MGKTYERKFLLPGWSFRKETVHKINELVFQIAKAEGLFTTVDKNPKYCNRKIEVGGSLAEFEEIVRKKLEDKGVSLILERKLREGDQVASFLSDELIIVENKPVIRLTYALQTKGCKSGAYHSDDAFISDLITLLHEGAHVVSYYYLFYLLAEAINGPEDLKKIYVKNPHIESNRMGAKEREMAKKEVEKYAREPKLTNSMWLSQDSGPQSDEHRMRTEADALNELWAIVFPVYALSHPKWYRSIMKEFTAVTNPELVEGVLKSGARPYECERDIGLVLDTVSKYRNTAVQSVVQEVRERFRGAVLSSDPKTFKYLASMFLASMLEREPKGTDVEAKKREYTKKIEEFSKNYGGYVKVPSQVQLKTVFRMAHNVYLAHRYKRLITHDDIHKFYVDAGKGK